MRGRLVGVHEKPGVRGGSGGDSAWRWCFNVGTDVKAKIMVLLPTRRLQAGGGCYTPGRQGHQNGRKEADILLECSKYICGAQSASFLSLSGV